jgi:hypothetical protein
MFSFFDEAEWACDPIWTLWGEIFILAVNRINILRISSP